MVFYKNREVCTWQKSALLSVFLGDGCFLRAFHAALAVLALYAAELHLPW